MFEEEQQTVRELDRRTSVYPFGLLEQSSIRVIKSDGERGGEDRLAAGSSESNKGNARIAVPASRFIEMPTLQ